MSKSAPPGTRPVLGIVGGGQLARMTLQAAVSLSVEARVLTAVGEEAAPSMWPDCVQGDAGDPTALDRFAAGCDVVTFDHEWVAPEVLSWLEERHVVRPRALTLRFTDKVHQRRELSRLGFPVPRFADSTADRIESHAGPLGWPVVVKEPRGGYDGRGVRIASSPADLPAIRGDAPTRAVLLEEHLGIQRELAVIVVRRPSGDQVTYPVVETRQVEAICHDVIAPASVPEAVASEAADLARGLADAVDAVGVLAVELFVVDGGRLVLNEISPRPHNSGHYTIEGTVTSQFENHIRGVLDLPLGDARLAAPAVAMVNVLGPADGSDPRDRLAEALAVPGAHVHLYGKSARPGRKLGHVTATGEDPAEVLERARAAVAALTEPR